ncbi:hypothetical protein A9Q87_05125 [Flavobacteriales bacterium 34_180_T64]|nr:hypothetical protein A9Q87_05125 [Flavobacteriales bacterium 34_180_T64]
MKKTFITLLFLVLTLSSFSQRKERAERIKALKIAFITERLELTADEAQQFWPVYNAFETKKNNLRKEGRKFRKNLDMASMTDDEAKELIDSMLAMELKRHELHTKQINDILKVLPAKKVILLKATEDAFNRRMLEEMKKRKDQFRKGKP